MASVIGPCVMLVALAQSGSDATAPEPPSNTIAIAPGYELTVLGGVWIPRLGGESSLGAGNPKIGLDNQLDLDDWEPSFNLEFELRRHDRWTLTLGGTDFAVSNSDLFVGDGDFGTVSLADGDAFSSNFEITTVFGEMAFSTWRPLTSSPERVADLDNTNSSGDFVANLHFAPLIGVRWIDVDQSISGNGNRENAGGEWLAVYAGFQMTLDIEPEVNLLHRLRLQAGLGLGPALADDIGFIWQVRAGMTLQFTENLGVMIGYRLLEMNVSNDDYELVGGLQGLFLAGSISF